MDIKALGDILLRIKEPGGTKEPDKENPDWQEHSLAFFSLTHSCSSVTDLLEASSAIMCNPVISDVF